MLNLAEALLTPEEEPEREELGHAEALEELLTHTEDELLESQVEEVLQLQLGSWLPLKVRAAEALPPGLPEDVTAALLVPL